MDKRARTHRTDLLLQFTWPESAVPERTAYVYVLYEHKSYPDRWVTLQLLRYLATIWQRLVSEPEKHRDVLLPEILPGVLYHGEEPWDAPLQFAELIQGGADSVHVPHYRPVFVNLTTIPDEKITGSLRAVLGLVALKHARLELKRATMELLAELLHRAATDPAAQHLAQVVEQVYVNVKNENEMDELMATASRRRYFDVEGAFMTYAQKMREKGSLQSRRDTLARQLDRKFGLMDTERERIMACEDQASLDAALDEFALAESKAQVLEKLS